MTAKVDTIEILEPIGDIGGPGRCKLAPRPKDLSGKVIGLMSNHVANADLLMEKLKKLIVAKIHPANVIVGTESELAGNCHAFVTGIGH